MKHESKYNDFLQKKYLNIFSVFAWHLYKILRNIYPVLYPALNDIFIKKKSPQWSVTLNITEQVNTSRIDIKRTSCSKWQGRRQTTVQYINWLSNQRAIQPYIYIYIWCVYTYQRTPHARGSVLIFKHDMLFIYLFIYSLHVRVCGNVHPLKPYQC